MELDVKWAGKSRADKIQEIRTKLKEKGASLFVLTSLDDIAWLLNIRGNDIHCCPVVLSYLVMDEKEIRLFANEKAFPESVKRHFLLMALPFIRTMIFMIMCRQYPGRKRSIFPEIM